MKLRGKEIVILVLTSITLIGIFKITPISQPPEFHLFADTRTLLGVRNFLNVFSNLPFLFTSIYGFTFVNTGRSSLPIFTIYSTLFLGVVLTAFGSAVYHYSPNNQTLVWDRLPMTVIFMSLTCATIAQFINERIGLLLLMPLLLLGMGSVLWWSYTQAYGHGDLRLYFWVQYYPMILIPLTLCLYYKPYHKPLIAPFIWIVFWYSIAKLLERWDIPIYNFLGISGHTLKHLAAAVSTWYFVELYRKTISIGQSNYLKSTAQKKSLEHGKKSW